MIEFAVSIVVLVALFFGLRLGQRRALRSRIEDLDRTEDLGEIFHTRIHGASLLGHWQFAHTVPNPDPEDQTPIEVFWYVAEARRALPKGLSQKSAESLLQPHHRAQIAALDAVFTTSNRDVILTTSEATEKDQRIANDYIELITDIARHLTEARNIAPASSGMPS